MEQKEKLAFGKRFLQFQYNIISANFLKIKQFIRSQAEKKKPKSTTTF